MKYRQLGRSGLRVPVISLGTGTFGGSGPLFGHWGTTDAAEARRLVDICLEAGVNMFDSADVYSAGAAERVLGEAIEGRRDRVLISTKIGLPMGEGPNEAGTSRARIITCVEDALRRLRTDYIDLLQLHAYDAYTPVEELSYTLDMMVRSGKVRYVGVSNFAGWQTMKTLAYAEQHGHPRPVAQQVYYSLIGRDYEHDLMPLGMDQGVAALVWSPLGWGRLTGKIRRGSPIPRDSRLNATAEFGPPVSDEVLYGIVDVLEAIAAEARATVPQVAIAWLLARPTVASVIIGARNERQLHDNLGAVDVVLDEGHMMRLDEASAVPSPLPALPISSSGGIRSAQPTADVSAA